MRPWLDDGDVRLYLGHVLDVLAELPPGSVDCIVTSPPYYGLRDYGVEGQIGLEPTPAAYVAALVAVFRAAWRVLADYGTVWVNLGDSYAQSSGQRGDTRTGFNERYFGNGKPGKQGETSGVLPVGRYGDVPPKNLLGMPWRVAFALQDDGWILRRDVVWAKPNPMPESVTDRCTSAHEYVFHLTKGQRYWYDADAVREANDPASVAHHDRYGGRLTNGKGLDGSRGDGDRPANGGLGYNPAGRNLRSVWEIATEPTPEAHFATFPRELVRRCLLAGCPEWVCRECGKPRVRVVERETMVIRRSERTHPMGRTRSSGSMLSPPSTVTLGWSDCGHGAYRRGLVLDPFVGSGTTCKVARDHGRHAVGIDLSAEYLRIAANRLGQLSLLTAGDV